MFWLESHPPLHRLEVALLVVFASLRAQCFGLVPCIFMHSLSFDRKTLPLRDWYGLSLRARVSLDLCAMLSLMWVLLI